MPKNGSLYRSTRLYQIALRGMLDDDWLALWKNLDLSVVHSADGATTMLIGCFDQAGLRGLLNRLWDLNLHIIAVNRQGKKEFQDG